MENFLLLTFILTFWGEKKGWPPDYPQLKPWKPQFTKIRLLDSILLPQSWVWANSLGPTDICRKHIIQKIFLVCFPQMLTIKKEFETTQFCLFSWYICNGYNLYVGERREMKWMKTSLCQQLESVEMEAKIWVSLNLKSK